MSALVIGNVTAVRDAAAMSSYRAHVLATLTAHGGRFAIRGGRVDVLEGGWRPVHLSVMEFPNAARARQWFASPEYGAILPMRQDADMELVIVSST